MTSETKTKIVDLFKTLQEAKKENVKDISSLLDNVKDDRVPIWFAGSRNDIIIAKELNISMDSVRNHLIEAGLIVPRQKKNKKNQFREKQIKEKVPAIHNITDVSVSPKGDFVKLVQFQYISGTGYETFTGLIPTALLESLARH